MVGDELLVISSDFAASVFDIDGGAYDRRLTFADRLLDVTAADVGENGAREIVAVSRNRSRLTMRRSRRVRG